MLAQERLETYRTARLRLATGKIRADRATRVFNSYAAVTTVALEKIYKDVETAFASYYRKVNEKDENAFTAKLIPSIGKLGFDVDFYGCGHFPPGAYHSEGHQDGMGISHFDRSFIVVDFDKISGALNDVISTSGIYKFAIAFSCAAYWYFAEIGALPGAESWEIRLSAAGAMLFGALWLAGVFLGAWKLSKATEKIKYKLYICSEKKRVQEYIPYMSEKDRLFVAHLLAKNEKTFVTDMNGGNAVNLIAQRLIYRTALSGHTYNMLRCPYEVPDHVWDVLQENKDYFLN